MTPGEFLAELLAIIRANEPDLLQRLQRSRGDRPSLGDLRESLRESMGHLSRLATEAVEAQEAADAEWYASARADYLAWVAALPECEEREQ